MAFNIPKAWSPGLAIPQYIRDEGLERHAFTTLEAPDGTYDNPAVGNGGYAVPAYILAEGYGQGAAITKWAPRGTYFGPKIPNWLNAPGNRITSEKKVPGGVQFQMQTLGSLGDTNAIVSKSGNRAMLTTVLASQVAAASPTTSSAGMSMGAKMAVGASVVVGGFLLFRHFRKKGG